MIVQILILCLGLVLLYFGSELLVTGAASTALLLAVKPVIVGLTVVSLATSAPELLVSLVAAVKGSSGISLGNILGSNVINIALVLGISSIIKPVKVHASLIRFDIPCLIIITILFWLLCIDNLIGLVDGIILLLLLVSYLVYGIFNSREKGPAKANLPRNRRTMTKYGIMVLAGILLLAKGADMVVQNAILLAVKAGLSQTFIGISIVALGTSLPELATSAVAASRGESDITLGNVVGSNLFNICMVMGIVGIFNPMHVDPGLHWFEFPFMVFITALLAFAAVRNRQTGKAAGIFFVMFFIFYITVSFLK